MKIRQADWDFEELEFEGGIGAIQQQGARRGDIDDLENTVGVLLSACRRLMRQIQLDFDLQETAIPENIISFRAGGFDVNVDNMKTEKRYRFRFEGSLYEIWKNDGDELELREVP